MRSSNPRAAAPLRLAIVLLFACILPARAQQAQGPGGHWAGAIALPGRELRFEVNLASKAGAWTGDISIPQQNASGLPLTNLAVSGDTVTFEIQGVPGTPTFRGVLQKDAQKVAGEFRQGGQAFPFSMERGAGAAAAAASSLEGFDAWIGQALTDWKVPGTAVAVVKDGKVVMSKGFGYRDVAGQLPVTPKTLFAIGSASKAFTTFAMGRLVDQGKMEWEKPVIAYISELRLADEYATMHLTPLDMVTHRSGLPRHDLLWYNNADYDAKQLVDRLAYLPPNKGLRQTWQYNNIMFGLAGQLVARLYGKPWEDAVREMVLEPLGMSSTNFSVAASQKAPDFALPYGEEADTIRKIGFRDISNAVEPAGAINSSVEDMAKWVTVHLNGGRADGKPVIQPSTLRFLHTPQMVIAALPADADLGPTAYAPGWMVDQYRGHLRVEHGGNIDGFSALVTLFPNDNAGMVVLTNKNGTPLPEFAVRDLADRLFGLKVRDWSGPALAQQKAMKALAKEGDVATEGARVKNTKPSHPLADYAGDYENPGYGRISIARKGEGLEVAYHRITAPLNHWHYDVFRAGRNPDDPTFNKAFLQFGMDLDGNIETLSAKLEPTEAPILFTHAPDPQLSDAAYLQRFVGSYQVGPQVAVVAISGNTLTATLPMQPTYTLLPKRYNTFALKGLEGYQLQFQLDAAGKVTGAVFNQPNGRIPAKRL